MSTIAEDDFSNENCGNCGQLPTAPESIHSKHVIIYGACVSLYHDVNKWQPICQM